MRGPSHSGVPPSVMWSNFAERPQTFLILLACYTCVPNFIHVAQTMRWLYYHK